MWTLALEAVLGTSPQPSHVPPAAVVGGEPSTEGTWPGVAALYGFNESFACTGVLIAPDLVLTAGHCGYGITDVELGTVVLGQGERRKVVDNIVHPDYFTTFDAALLVLDEPFTETVASLALDCIADDLLINGSLATIVGFGATDMWATEWTGRLNEAQTQITDAVCENTAVGCNEEVSPGGELIAGGDGIDSCTGDSGGPLFAQDEQGNTWLAGITSRATIPAPTPCGSGGIYVRADALASWIEAQTGQSLSRPDCEGLNRLPVATAEPILVETGRTAGSLILVNDPDLEQHHVFSWVSRPTHGLAELDPDGAVYYRAPDMFVGEDLAVIEVTDDGVPARTFEVEIPIVVSSSGLSVRGCAASPSVVSPSNAVVLTALGTLLARRRAR